MAMRRIWIIVGMEPMADGTVTVQIEDDGDTRKPAVYDNYLTAQDDCDETNADMQAAVDRGDMQSFEEVRPQAAWLTDETGIISTRIEHGDFDFLDIPDLQHYCEQQGLI